MHNRDFTLKTFRMDRHFIASRKHICSLCGKRRSSRYGKLHPLAPGQVPEPGICSRPKCATAVNEMLLRLPYRLIIYEIHHHHQSSTGLEEPPPGYTTKARLPGLSPIQEESEPEEPSPNSTATELSSESSLTRRIELPDNRLYSGRHPFKRFHILVESPPPVNSLKKPTLQKQKEAL